MQSCFRKEELTLLRLLQGGEELYPGPDACRVVRMLWGRRAKCHMGGRTTGDSVPGVQLRPHFHSSLLCSSESSFLGFAFYLDHFPSPPTPPQSFLAIQLNTSLYIYFNSGPGKLVMMIVVYVVNIYVY